MLTEQEAERLDQYRRAGRSRLIPREVKDMEELEKKEKHSKQKSEAEE